MLDNPGKICRLLFVSLFIAILLPTVVLAQVDENTEGTIVVSINANVPEEAYTALIDAYHQIRPNVEIIWEHPGSVDYPTWLGTQLAAGDIRPDIVSGNYVPTFDGYVDLNTQRYLTNPHTNRMWDEDLDWDFFVSRNAVGERIMLPTRGVHISWFYNKAMFEQAGVEPPTNWDEFVTVVEKLQETFPDIAPIAIDYNIGAALWLGYAYFDQHHLDWIETVRARPGDWNYTPSVDDNFVFDPNITTIHNTYTLNLQRYYAGLQSGELRFDTPEMAEIVRQMSRIFPQYAVPDFYTTNLNDIYNRFISQQAAIMLNGSWSRYSLLRDFTAMSPERLEALGLTDTELEPFEWGTFENPPMENPMVISPVRTSESATGEYISVIEKDQQQTDLTLDFVKFWLSYAGYTPYLEAMAQSPTATFSGPLRVQDVRDVPEVEALWEDIQWMGSSSASYNYEFLSWGGGDVRTRAFEIWREGLEGITSPEETAANLQKLIDDNFETILQNLGLTQDDLDNPARQPGS